MLKIYRNKPRFVVCIFMLFLAFTFLLVFTLFKCSSLLEVYIMHFYFIITELDVNHREWINLIVFTSTTFWRLQLHNYWSFISLLNCFLWVWNEFRRVTLLHSQQPRSSLTVVLFCMLNALFCSFFRNEFGMNFIEWQCFTVIFFVLFYMLLNALFCSF